MGKIILLNGPPYSGKDTAAKHIQNVFPVASPDHNGYKRPALDRMSMPIKKAFAGLINAQCTPDGIVEPYESHKEEIIPQLGVSYRQWQIDFSEKFMKPLYGENIFGRSIVPRITRRFAKGIANLVVIPDCGFQIEVSEIYSSFDPKDILLMRCHRPGFYFSNDSRSYVHAPKGCTYAALYNDSSVESFQKYVESAVKLWLADPSKLPREE